MKRLAARMARRLVRASPRRRSALVLALSGDLGSGKTVFVQGFLRALGVKQRVISPTFLIFRPYRLPGILHFKTAYHVDLYRIKRRRELNVLGFKRILKNPDNIVIIEWAEKARRLLPQGTRWIKFKHKTETSRTVIFGK